MTLTAAGVPFSQHVYEHDPAARSYGQEAVDALGLPAEQMFKTLLVDTGAGLAVAVVPVAGSLDLKAMAASNCSMIFMGVDSGDEDIRRTLMERPMTDDLIYSKATMIHNHGIGTFLSTIYGSPGENADQMMKTLDMVANIRPTQCSGNVFYPLPKTKLFDYAVEIGQLSPEGFKRVQTGDSGFQFLDLLLLWGERLALRGDACAFLQKLTDPTAQGRLANAE